VNLKDVRPMLANSATQLPKGDQWSYEVKWDGYRTLATKDRARATLLSRNLKDATAQYPTVARAVAQIRDMPNGRDRLIRHPEFVGIRNDNDPRAVKRET
jgi:bifunctional non-homologous end joining protein LigD